MGVQVPTERDAFFIRFYEEEFHKMWKYALSILTDPVLAEEVVQDAFVEVLQNVDEIMTWENPDRWLRRVVKNKARHLYRDRMREMSRLVYLDARGGDNIPGSDQMEKIEKAASENIAVMKKKIREKLSEEDLQLLVHFLRKNKTYKDMSRETGRSIAFCQKRVQRIRAKLAKIF